jgi:hypothetical protein
MLSLGFRAVYNAYTHRLIREMSVPKATKLKITARTIKNGRINFLGIGL